MQYSEAKQGRIFVIRLEDGDVVHEEIERFAEDHSIRAGFLTIIGGADTDSRLVVGPEDGRAVPITPMVHQLTDVHEVAGVGTLFPDGEGKPVLHMHAACGRKASAITGCIRTGVKTWQILEVILVELLDTSAKRVFSPETGFNLLRP